MRMAERAGVRLRIISMGPKRPRYDVLTEEETRALLLALHVKRGKNLVR
jgi:hypothetical protein